MSKTEAIEVDQILMKDKDGCTCVVLKFGLIKVMMDMGIDEHCSEGKIM